MLSCGVRGEGRGWEWRTRRWRGLSSCLKCRGDRTGKVMQIMERQWMQDATWGGGDGCGETVAHGVKGTGRVARWAWGEGQDGKGGPRERDWEKERRASKEVGSGLCWRVGGGHPAWEAGATGGCMYVSVCVWLCVEGAPSPLDDAGFGRTCVT